MMDMVLKDAGSDRRTFHDDISIVLLYLPFQPHDFGSVQRHYSRSARTQLNSFGVDSDASNSHAGSAESTVYHSQLTNTSGSAGGSRMNLLGGSWGALGSLDHTGSSQNEYAAAMEEGPLFEEEGDGGDVLRRLEGDVAPLGPELEVMGVP